MNCYYQGCTSKAVTKEHIPPKSFFPKDEKEQLLTVKSCVKHNNLKSVDDIYVLAQICMNASPSNRAQEVWMEKVVPQLNFNNGALRKRLVAGSKQLPNGEFIYKVDSKRINDFFDALSFGLVFKVCNASLPIEYAINHIYCNFTSDVDPLYAEYKKLIEDLYNSIPMGVLEFGNPKIKNERIYTVELFGKPDFSTSITIVHVFFGKFKVVSMLTKQSIKQEVISLLNSVFECQLK